MAKSSVTTAGQPPLLARNAVRGDAMRPCTLNQDGLQKTGELDLEAVVRLVETADPDEPSTARRVDGSVWKLGQRECRSSPPQLTTRPHAKAHRAP